MFAPDLIFTKPWSCKAAVCLHIHVATLDLILKHFLKLSNHSIMQHGNIVWKYKMLDEIIQCNNINITFDLDIVYKIVIFILTDNRS